MEQEFELCGLASLAAASLWLLHSFAPQDDTGRCERLICPTALQAQAPAGQAAAKGPNFADVAKVAEQQLGEQQGLIAKLAAASRAAFAAQVKTQYMILVDVSLCVCARISRRALQAYMCMRKSEI